MDHDSEKSHDEAREGHEMRNEHAHPHHMKNTTSGAEKKHVARPDAPSPGEQHRGGPLPNEKK